MPEIAEQFREVPKNATPLSSQELRTAFDQYIDFIEKQKWWKVGLDPAKTNHPPSMKTGLSSRMDAESFSGRWW